MSQLLHVAGKPLTVAELAQRAGVTSEAVRYWERTYSDFPGRESGWPALKLWLVNTGRWDEGKDVPADTYAKSRRSPGPLTGATADAVPWTSTQEKRLLIVLAEYPPPDPVPWAEVAALVGHRTTDAVKLKAARLGYRAGVRSSRPMAPRKLCEVCGQAMSVPITATRGKTCSGKCGAILAQVTYPNAERPRPEHTPERSQMLSANAKAWIERNGHPRGMAGKNHTAENKVLYRQKSLAVWANMSDEQKAK